MAEPNNGNGNGARALLGFVQPALLLLVGAGVSNGISQLRGISADMASHVARLESQIGGVRTELLSAVDTVDAAIRSHERIDGHSVIIERTQAHAAELTRVDTRIAALRGNIEEVMGHLETTARDLRDKISDLRMEKKP